MACGGLLCLNSWTGAVAPLEQGTSPGLPATCRPKEQRKLVPPCLEVLIHDHLGHLQLVEEHLMSYYFAAQMT